MSSQLLHRSFLFHYLFPASLLFLLDHLLLFGDLVDQIQFFFANVVCPTIPILLNICSGLDAPISTLVTSLSFNSQESAICGRLCPLSFARASSFLIFSIFSGVMSDAWRNLPSLATRLSAGIPLMYFLITFPVPED